MHVLSRGYPVRREPGGPIVRIVGTHFDLTERKRAEAERARTEFLTRLVFAQEDERRRIAREMHDQFGEQLTALAASASEVLKDACGDHDDLARARRLHRRHRAASRQRRGPSGLGASSDRARRSRSACRARQLRPGLVESRRHPGHAAHLGTARRSTCRRRRNRAVSHRAGGADERGEAREGRRMSKSSSSAAPTACC